MHDVPDAGITVPAFLAKLWKMVDDPETDDLICWGANGQSFIIMNSAQFTHELLPMYYKHNNLASFIRQLNMYGFHKLASTECGGLKSEKDYMEFSHTCFVKGHPYLLENIKRKMVTGSRAAPVLSFAKNLDVGESINVTQSDVLAQVLSDVNNLKSKQASWDAKLAAMKRENETLWRELAVFRQKHIKQEQIINKLIRFIVTMVQPSARKVPLRRRYPLMLTKSGHGSGSSFSGPSIRELDPAELILDNGEVITVGQGVGKRRATYYVPDAMDDNQEEDLAEFIPSTLVADNSPYVVMSPDANEEPVQINGPNNATWLNLDLSDADSDAMTLVDPNQINQNVLTSVKDEQSEKQSLPVLLVVPPRENEGPPAKVQKKSSKGGTAITKGRRGRKNNAPKKTRRKNTKNSKQAKHEVEESLDVGIEMEPGTSMHSSGMADFPSDVVTIPEDVLIKEEEELDPTTLLDTELGIQEEATADPMSLALVRPSGNSYNAEDITRYVLQKDLGGHVDTIQGDLDILKEFLKSDSCSLDASALMELFGDDPLAFNMPPASDNKTKEGEDCTGNELMTYGQPNLLDLVDMYGSGVGSLPPPSPLSPTTSLLETPLATPRSATHTKSLSLGKKRK